jgi:hypothetical protein
MSVRKFLTSEGSSYPSPWSVENLPVRKQIHPCNLQRVSDWSPKCDTSLTAIVPKMAPLAPTDGTPTSAKLPPKTLLKRR